MDIGFYKTYFEVEKNHWLMRIRRLIVKDVIFSLYGEKNRSIKILDYGSGSGFLVGELQKIGFNVSGLDMSKEAIDYGTSQGIKNLKVITSRSVDFPDNTFDVVLALDVLEHIEDEAWSLKDIERVLKPEGRFIMMVPAYMFLWGIQDEVAHHYRRYTKGSLLREINKSSSLENVRITYFNTFLFAPIALVRLASRLLHIRARESDFDLNSPLINKICFFIMNTERKLLKKMNYPFGISILAVFKKN